MKKAMKIALPIIAIGVACRVVHTEIVRHKRLYVTNKVMDRILKNPNHVNSDVVVSIIKG